MYWTQKNEHEAFLQGWRLARTPAGSVIVREEALSQFGTDAAALMFVETQASTGDSLAHKALKLHQAARMRPCAAELPRQPPAGDVTSLDI